MPKKRFQPDNFHELLERYKNKEVSVTDIANATKSAKATVLKWMDEFGVARHPAREMISVKLVGRTGHRKGAKHTPETLAKISAARSGKATTTGFKFSNESRLKMSLAAKARWSNVVKDKPVAVKKTKNANPEKKVNAKVKIFLTTEEKIARQRARDACKRMLRRILTMSRVRKDAKTEVLLGYSKHQLREHLEKQFKEGMSWSVRNSFHIDHIKPVAQFFREGIFDPAVINALENLQVLTPEENHRKSDKFSNGTRAYA